LQNYLLRNHPGVSRSDFHTHDNHIVFTDHAMAFFERHLGLSKKNRLSPAAAQYIRQALSRQPC